MRKNITFILTLLLVALVSSCNDNPVLDLTLNVTNLEINKHEIAKISIESGNGKYSVESSDETIATVAISGTTVAIYGVEGGVATITITDEKHKTTLLNVTVAYAVPTNATFIWNKQSYKFDTPDGYGISVLNGGIALTNLDEGKQLNLYWTGGLSEGEKTNATLTIDESLPVEDNAEPAEPIELVFLKVVRSDPVRGYYLIFNDGERTGELFFLK